MYAKLGQENLLSMVRWMRWHCPPDTGFEFEPSRSEAEHATSRSRRLPIILNLYEWAGKKQFVSLKLEYQSWVRTRDLRLPKQAALTTAPGPPPIGLKTHDYKFALGVSTVLNLYKWEGDTYSVSSRPEYLSGGWAPAWQTTAVTQRPLGPQRQTLLLS